MMAKGGIGSETCRELVACFFFFQAEDGIRDVAVTGVQTCALPIYTVITAGSVGDRFYLIRSGRVRAVAPDGTVHGELVPGEGFGELALLDRTPRSATVEALEPTELWSLDSSHFQRWVRDRVEIASRIRADQRERGALAGLPFFRDLDS